MKDQLIITPSDLNFDQVEILKLQNAVERKKENRLYAFLLIDAIALTLGIIYYASL